MDKATFCAEIERKLGDAELWVRSRAEARPSTREKSLQQERERPLLGKLRDAIAAANAGLAELRASTDPAWQPLRADLESRLAEINRLLGDSRR